MLEGGVGPNFSRWGWGVLKIKVLRLGAALKNIQYLEFITHRPPPIINDRSLTPTNL
jgi:hypothetical protein